MNEKNPSGTKAVGADMAGVPVELGVPGEVSRRRAIQWVLAAVAASALPRNGFGQPVGRTPTPQEHASTQPGPTLTGYGVDPNLVKFYKPGDFWPLTFNDAQRKAAIALADVIIPADRFGPAASAAGVPAMVDEWVSAPYPSQQADRPVVLEGLAWIDAEARKRFGGKAFADLSDQQKHAVCDDICYTGSAKPEFRKAAQFFSKFRSLCAGAYYATPAGWQAIGYVGNAPLTRFDGPPADVLRKLGVTQTVKEPKEDEGE